MTGQASELQPERNGRQRTETFSAARLDGLFQQLAEELKQREKPKQQPSGLGLLRPPELKLESSSEDQFWGLGNDLESSSPNKLAPDTELPGFQLAQQNQQAEEGQNPLLQAQLLQPFVWLVGTSYMTRYSHHTGCAHCPLGRLPQSCSALPARLAEASLCFEKLRRACNLLRATGAAPLKSTA